LQAVLCFQLVMIDCTGFTDVNTSQTFTARPTQEAAIGFFYSILLGQRQIDLFEISNSFFEGDGWNLSSCLPPGHALLKANLTFFSVVFDLRVQNRLWHALLPA